VAFRLDDIQDFYVNAVQMAIITEFQQNDMPISVGAIANYLGTDMELISFLQSAVQSYPWLPRFDRDDFVQTFWKLQNASWSTRNES
jgi:hypothetical protein